MKQKIFLWCAEYMVYVGALVVCVFLFQQPALYRAIVMFLTMVITITSLWFIGACLKYVIRKERPHREQKTNVERDRYAFPSMHALTLAGASAYIGMHSVVYGCLMYAIACTVMYARVRTRMHYAVDMFAGFFLGIVYVYTLSPLIEKYISFFL